jgi:hypothetical protein
MQAEGSHYVPGQTVPKGPVEPAIWTADNTNDFVNMSWMRLDNPVPGWPQDQVKLRRKLIFDGLDPRVKLSSAIAPHDPAIAEIEETSTEHSPALTPDAVGYVFVQHSPALTPDAVGYVFVRFAVHPLQKFPPNCTVTITPTIGPDTYPPITVTKDNHTNAIWEVFSDKYIQESEFSYTMSVEFDGPNFTDEPVIVTSPAPVKVPVAQGIIKYVNPLSALIPDIPSDKLAIVNDYIKQAVIAPA